MDKYVLTNNITNNLKKYLIIVSHNIELLNSCGLNLLKNILAWYVYVPTSIYKTDSFIIIIIKQCIVMSEALLNYVN